MKKYLFLILCIFMITSCKSQDEESYEKFSPIYFNTVLGKYEKDKLNINLKFYANLEIVLRNYSEDYKIVEGIIYVKKELLKDKDLCLSYTKKAQDSAWISSRLKE